MRTIREPSYWWILSLMFLTLPKHKDCHPVALGGQPLHHAGDGCHERTGVMRERRAAGDPYWSYSGNHGPRSWVASYPECAANNQSPVDIADEQALISEEYQELVLDKFNAESSNQTTMKNTGKTGAEQRPIKDTSIIYYLTAVNYDHGFKRFVSWKFNHAVSPLMLSYVSLSIHVFVRLGLLSSGFLCHLFTCIATTD